MNDNKMILVKSFRLDMIPPRTTAQQRKWYVGKDGKPHSYEPEKVQAAKDSFLAYLFKEKLDSPLSGPLALITEWYFPTKDKSMNGKWKDTKPDTDNIQKLFKDCMTELAFWNDDAQVVLETVSKRWSTIPGIAVHLYEFK